MRRKQRRSKHPVRCAFQAEPLEPRQMLSVSIPSGVAPSVVLSQQQIAQIVKLLNTAPQTYDSFDGTGNNAQNPELGSVNQQLLRDVAPAYDDGISSPAGQDRVSAREVSNDVLAQTESTPSSQMLTKIVWAFGEFVDHDLDLTLSADPAEPLPIAVPTGDPSFDPTGTGTQTIDFNRSAYDTSTGDSIDNPRQQINMITAFLDGSVIYGSSEDVSNSLRTFEGGRLKTSDGNLLPLDDNGFFFAGDIRTDDNTGLMAVETIFMREHNYWADKIGAASPSLTDEQIFREARTMVVAELQAITYNEYLPTLFGANAIGPYTGYDHNVDPQVANLFSTAAYRFGHSMLDSTLPRLDADGNTAPEGDLALRDAFLNPGTLIDYGIDSVTRGMTATLSQEVDPYLVDDIRNFLFGPPGAGGFDLGALDVQRGRDNGLPDYNTARVELGLAPVTSFADITSDTAIQAKLQETYGSVDNIDVFVGGLAEDHVPGSTVGELFQTIMVDQFQRTRAGDSNWYQNVLKGKLLDIVNHTSLKDVIERNSGVTGLQRNVFLAPSLMQINAAPGRRPGNVAITTQNDRIIARDGGRVVDNRAADDISKIVVQGVDNRRDTVTIDLRRGDLNLSDGMVIYGGVGPGDLVNVITGRATDEISVDGNTMTINGRTITFDGVEQLTINGRGDHVQVSDQTDMHVRVIGARPMPLAALAAQTLGQQQQQPQQRNQPAPPPPPPGDNQNGNGPNGPSSVMAQLLGVGAPDANPLRLRLVPTRS